MTEGLDVRGAVADEWFERIGRTPMTKAPIRSLAISLLSPLAGARALEIGSGTGAMTVELMRAVGDAGRVTSLEASASAVGIVKRNIDRSGLAARVDLIEGRAPEDIPGGSFGVVFIGGHGSALEEIMKACWDRLENGGRLLLTAISPGTSARALSRLDLLGAETGFWRIHSSVGRRAGKEWLLQGNNPIDLIWGDKQL
jgi:precorrin-6Y C5,15-methyltransferase (decarboxylating) CbiT subunit